MSSRNRYKEIRCTVACTVAIETSAKSVANRKEFSSFILDSFSNFSASQANWKEPKPPKFFVDAGVSF